MAIMTPISPAERIEVLDVLRGAALFGIIAANMRAFNSPQAAYIDHSLLWTGTGDRIAQGAIDLFITGKFVTLFSFLFGIGFAVQMDRAAARSISPRSFYVRRLTVLLLIGLAHMFLLWWGDILAAYALMGFPLLLFRKRSQKTILIWAGALYAWPLILTGAALIAFFAGVPLPTPHRATSAELRRTIEIFANGTYAQMLQERLKEDVLNLLGLLWFYPRSLSLFLFGLWTWRTGIIRALGEHVLLLRRCLKWGLIAGLAGNGAVLVIDEVFRPDRFSPSVTGFLELVLGSAAVPALSLFYASAVALLSRAAAWRPRLAPFAATGRTALSNYLLQTVICTTLYNSWGGGLYGSVGPLLGLAPTFLIYAAELAASARWMRRFAFGPMEWVWRVLTYGRVQTVARAAATGA